MIEPLFGGRSTSELLAAPPPTPVAATAAYEREIRPHPYLHDGRYANNPWLQELPDPITKLTWDNAAQLSSATAHQLGVETGDLISVSVEGRSLEVPALVVPGQADGTVPLFAGYGRRGGERIANGIGVAVMHWTSGAAVSLAATARKRALAIPQPHWQLEGRDELTTGSLAQHGGNEII